MGGALKGSLSLCTSVGEQSDGTTTGCKASKDPQSKKQTVEQLRLVKGHNCPNDTQVPNV